MIHVGSPLPEFETGFAPWDEYSSYFESVPVSEPGLVKPVHFLPSPVGSSSGSDLTCYHAGLDTPLDGPSQNYVKTMSGSDFGSGSDEPNRNPEKEQNEPFSIMEERRRKRKLSNRESARRSRMRKRNELENLRTEANRLKLENRHRGNQLSFVNHNLQMARMNNDRLKVESIILQNRLTEIAQFLHFQELEQSYNYVQ